MDQSSIMMSRSRLYSVSAVSHVTGITASAISRKKKFVFIDVDQQNNNNDDADGVLEIDSSSGSEESDDDEEQGCLENDLLLLNKDQADMIRRNLSLV